ncbi:hypothetical protein MESS4_750038 [Mesorhizobium sp. STM 4661]|nr:hypothetical protein MESS4_750038 [Mesorhizobium sp. STM 4661]
MPGRCYRNGLGALRTCSQPILEAVQARFLDGLAAGHLLATSSTGGRPLSPPVRSPDCRLAMAGIICGARPDQCPAMKSAFGCVQLSEGRMQNMNFTNICIYVK